VIIFSVAAAGMVDHARQAAPMEACGLVGIDGAGSVVAFHPVSNAAASTRRFVIDPADLFAAHRHFTGHGLSIGGWFHSHPAGPSAPSATDVAEWPDRDWVSVIAAGVDGTWELGAFRLSGEGRVMRLPVEVRTWAGR
jgi:proteasome lid subunit RPN8/RPN11